MNYEQYSFGAYNLHIINTKKFKTISVSINFRSILKKENITIRNLLKMVLLDSNKEFNNERDLVIETERLYDLKLSSSTSRLGNAGIITFDLNFLNEKYTEKGMNKESLDFLMNILFKPNVIDNKFDSFVVDKCKNCLRKNIETEKDNKTKYSILKLLENMGDYPYSYNPNGYIEDLDKIDGSSLYEYYKKGLSNDLIDIIIVGEISDSEKIKNYFLENFKVNTYKKNNNEITLQDILPRKRINKIIEKDSVNQTKLSIGLRVNNMTDYERKYVLRLYNEILGGSGGNSILFDSVREKNSLAYYIYSLPWNYDNLLIIYSGINSSKIDMAIKIIKKTLTDIQKGKIDDNMFESSKKSIISAIDISEDSPKGIINSAYAKILVGSDDIDTKRQKYQQITKFDVITLSKKIKLDTIFLLEGATNESN